MARSAGQASVEASVADLMTRPSTPAMATRLPAGTKGTGCMAVPIIMKRPRGLLPSSGRGCAWLAVERRLGWYLGPSTKRRESGRSTPLKTRAKATNTSAGASAFAPPPSACVGGRHPTSSAARTGTTLETKATTGAASVLAHAATEARTSAIAPSSSAAAAAAVLVVAEPVAAAAEEEGMGSGGQSAAMRRCWALAGSGTTSTTMSRTAGARGSQRRKMADAVPRGSLGFSSRGGTSWGTARAREGEEGVGVDG